MKKRFLTFILAIATMLMCIFGFSACGGKVEFKINFVVENEVYATVSTGGNEVISMPENPTKDDYTFDGWYWDENTWEKPFTANSLLDAPLSSDMKVYAKFNKNHTHEYTPTTTEPTCTEKGIITYTCTCGDSYTKEIPATGEHTWDDGKITTEPTCTEKGVKTFTCTVCKTATKTEPIDKLPHEHAEKWTSNATYHWHECVCGDKKGEEKHTAGAPATATTPQTCTVCGYVLQVETGILFNTLTVDGTNVYGKVSNDTEIFSFINEITVKGDATYVVDVNMSCKDPIESKTVELSVGDNKFYVLEKIGNNVKLFTVTIRRRPMYDVTFNANGGTAVDKQVIEEDNLATEPETTRTGYTFTGWDYDFATPIIQTTKITASWSANKDTKYTVNYYLQNLDDNNYTLKETVELKGETDTTATAEIKEYTHFTCNQNMGKISGNINGDGGQVLNVYYTRDKYVISTARNNTKAGTVTASGTYKFDKQITLTATTNAGYTWLGWYDGETLVCESEEFTFKAEKDVIYTATWSANTDTKYTVNYYLQNLDDNEHTLHESVELEGETDTTVTAEIKEYTHFTYNANKSVISGNIDGDGGQVLSVYYTRNTYTLSINNSDAGTITNSGTYKYGNMEMVSEVTTHIGYEFVGWYCGEELLSTDATYTFTVDKNVTAKFAVKEEMSNFNFTSTATACSITGVKDRSVTEIVVPDYVTSISQGAFKGCSSLESITIPFVGGSRKTASDTYQYPFGYIFGTSSYTGGTATKQYYYGSSTSSTTSTTYYIPTSLKMVTVTGGNILRGAFYYCSRLTSVEIGDSVTSIGSYAFSGCSSLESLTIPFVGGSRKTASDTYQYPFGYIFGKSSYTGGTATTQYYYGSSTSSTTSTTYYIPTSLKAVTVTGGDILRGAFYECDSLTSIEIPDSITSIGSSAFSSCDSLTSITIPDSVTSIGEGAFSSCDSLTSVVIPDSVTSIGSYAFRGCNSLTSVVIGDSVTLIGNYAFYNCDSLTSVEIPDSVTSIGSYAFYNCSSLTSITVDTNNTVYKSIDGNLYSKDGKMLIQYAIGKTATSFTIPNSVTSIGDDAFEGCRSLTSITIPDSVTSIGDDAFSSCYKLVEVVNKSTHITVTKGNSSNGYIGYYALAVYNSGDTFETKLSNDNGYIIYTDGNEKILVGYNGTETDLVLPSYITKINRYAFSSCDSLTSVVIPDSVTSIGNSAFGGCSSLKSITIPFVGGSRKTASDTYQYPFGYIFGTSSYTGGTATTQYYYGSSTSSTTSTTYYIPTSLKSVTITGGNILRGAFGYCRSLTSVVIGDSVTSIGNSAFCECDSLTSVVIPDSVTSIGDDAFRYCYSLTSVEIGDSVTSIGSSAFYYCSSLTSVEIGDSVTSIGFSAFYNCDSLTSVVIPDSVTSIGDYAFYDCTSLTSITFKDTSTWYRTTNYSYWNNKTGGTSTNVTNSSTNATYFKSTYYDYYWYKK